MLSKINIFYFSIFFLLFLLFIAVYSSVHAQSEIALPVDSRHTISQIDMLQALTEPVFDNYNLELLTAQRNYRINLLNEISI